MNKLSYGLLSLLSTEPQTGYDLMLRLNQFWHTTHSAIYPLLSELEEKQCVSYTLIGQSSKPDKKVYSITELGKEMLKKWIASTTDEAITKDEMMLKLYCMQNFDIVTVDKLLNEMEDRYHKRLDKYTKSLEKITVMANNSFDSYKTQRFGAYILLQKVMCDAKIGIKWCEWIRDLCNKKEGINCLDDNFSDYL